MKGLRAKQIRAHARIAAIGLKDRVEIAPSPLRYHPLCQRVIYQRMKGARTVTGWPIGSTRKPRLRRRPPCRGGAA